MDVLSNSTTIKKSDASLATTIDGEAVILETESGVYFGLNEVATYIWELLDEPRDLEELCEAVLSEYDVSRERCERDLQEVLRDLEGRGLVEFEDRPPE